MEKGATLSNKEKGITLDKTQILSDYKIAQISRQISLMGRKEVFMGKAKFGVFGDGKEIAQLAMVNLSINESSNIHRAGIIPIEAENMESKCRIFLLVYLRNHSTLYSFTVAKITENITHNTQSPYGNPLKLPQKCLFWALKILFPLKYCFPLSSDAPCLGKKHIL